MPFLIVGIAFSTKVDKKFLDFQDFIAKYHKSYDSPAEFMEKFEVFKNNQKIIKKNSPKKISNGKFNPNKQRFAPNQFSDMTQEEFRAKYLNLDVEQIRAMKESGAFRELHPEITKDLPESFDWREKGVVTPVKSQGDCGSCWSFATAATMESQYLLKTNKTLIMSEQQLIDCDKRNKGCRGGVMNKAYEYLMNNGMMSAEDYPYEENDEETQCRYQEDKAVMKVKSWGFSGTQDEEEIKALLIEKGPLSGAVNAFPLMFYAGGIFDPWFDFLCPSTINHAITIVGYGTDGTTPYWIIKNSWGESWGENGYFRLALGRGLCGINTFVLGVEGEVIEH